VTFQAWALFCLTETLLCLQPGPAVLLVVSIALTRGRGHGLAASLGVLAANTVYFAASATGLAALLRLSSQAYLAIQWLGAAYLIWMGARMLLRARARDGAVAQTGARGRSFWQGFATQAANPSLLVYFTAILPQFVDPGAPIAGQVAILAASSIAIELAVLSGYAALSQRAGRLVAPDSRVLLERFAGVLLIAAGAGLAAIGRD
jgi:threonine/homoserine/homoserine lactone efflux protein